MGGKPSGRVALFSIHPAYAEAILAGEKTVEFRRRGLPDDVWAVVIYATKPVAQVVGWFEIAEVVTAPPKTLWSQLGHAGAVKKDFFDRYFHAAGNGYGIRVRRSFRLRDRLPLSALAVGLRPPQSFQYLAPRTAQAVMRRSLAPVPMVSPS